MSAHIEKWERYRDSRLGTYEFRARTRYRDVADCLRSLGLNNQHTVLDVGAGSCQFGRFLREQNFQGTYIPVDAVIDGTDLETWYPPKRVDFIVCIETLEHLSDPLRLLRSLIRAARLGVVITTPNPDVVDAINCDPTHLTSLSSYDLKRMLLTVETHSWFGTPKDSLLAWGSYGPRIECF